MPIKHRRWQNWKRLNRRYPPSRIAIQVLPHCMWRIRLDGRAVRDGEPEGAGGHTHSQSADRQDDDEHAPQRLLVRREFVIS